MSVSLLEEQMLFFYDDGCNGNNNKEKVEWRSEGEKNSSKIGDPETYYPEICATPVPLMLIS